MKVDKCSGWPLQSLELSELLFNYYCPIFFMIFASILLYLPVFYYSVRTFIEENFLKCSGGRL
jgi:hypothetical protein